MQEKTQTMDETTTTSRRDSGELPFVMHPVTDLVINVIVLTEVQQEADIDRLRQLPLVVHMIRGCPSRGDLHHLL